MAPRWNCFHNPKQPNLEEVAKEGVLFKQQTLWKAIFQAPTNQCTLIILANASFELKNILQQRSLFVLKVCILDQVHCNCLAKVLQKWMKKGCRRRDLFLRHIYQAITL